MGYSVEYGSGKNIVPQALYPTITDFPATYRQLQWDSPQKLEFDPRNRSDLP